MILGIGSDLANIERIAHTVERFGERFLARVFTETERALAERRAATAATLAKRWAAKEACSKALGTGLRMGIRWRDMGVVNLRSGQPTMRLKRGWRLQAASYVTVRSVAAAEVPSPTDRLLRVRRPVELLARRPARESGCC